MEAGNMKETGILFSAPMVRAILAGEKTQTRRAMKPQPPEDDTPLACEWFTPSVLRANGEMDATDVDIFGTFGEGWSLKCPYGAPGDRLWVRETCWASRITLELVSVRVERVRDISDADIAAEGVTPESVRALGGEPDDDTPPRMLWRYGWTEINGAESWDANPWVWVIEFRRIA